MAFDLVGIFTSPLIEQLLTVVLIIILTYLVVRFYRIIITRIAGTVPSGLVASLQQIGSWAIWILGVIIILNTLNVSILLLLVLLFLRTDNDHGLPAHSNRHGCLPVRLNLPALQGRRMD